MKRTTSILAAAGGLVVLTLALQGCDTSVQVFRTTPSPTYYYESEVPAPPAPLYDRVPPAPGPRHTWVNGYWDWNGRQYVWVRGYWAVPPSGATIWIAPRYESRRYYHGYWRYDNDRRYDRHDRRDRH